MTEFYDSGAPADCRQMSVSVFTGVRLQAFNRFAAMPMPMGPSPMMAMPNEAHLYHQSPWLIIIGSGMAAGV